MNRRDFFSTFAAGTLAGACFRGKSLRAAADSVLAPWEIEVQRQIADGKMRGAVGIIGTADTILEQKAFGLAQWTPREVPMTLDSRFDLASVTKTFTTAAIGSLIAAGKIDPDAPFTEYLPEHILNREKPAGYVAITVRDLATHTAGFDNSKPYMTNDSVAYQRAFWTKKPVRPRGEKFEYTCYAYVLLGTIVERILQKRLDVACRESVFQPLGMTRSTWGPIPVDDTVVQVLGPHPRGTVADEAAACADFPVGNAGAFSTAGDLARFAQDILRQEHFPARYYSLIQTPTFEKDGARRSFGWDMQDALRPVGWSRETIFHSGYTGQNIWIDPTRRRFAVLLTNRTCIWAEGIQGRKVIAGKFF